MSETVGEDSEVWVKEGAGESVGLVVEEGDTEGDPEGLGVEEVDRVIEETGEEVDVNEPPPAAKRGEDGEGVLEPPPPLSQR